VKNNLHDKRVWFHNHEFGLFEETNLHPPTASGNSNMQMTHVDASVSKGKAFHGKPQSSQSFFVFFASFAPLREKETYETSQSGFTIMYSDFSKKQTYASADRFRKCTRPLAEI
jgi:hypothetical protein